MASILQPTRKTSHSKTLMDNTFWSIIEPDIILSNLTATISDHLPQFVIISDIFGNISGKINKIVMKGTGENLVEKMLFLTIFLLTGGFVKNWQSKCWQFNQNVFR